MASNLHEMKLITAIQKRMPNGTPGIGWEPTKNYANSQRLDINIITNRQPDRPAKSATIVGRSTEKSKKIWVSKKLYLRSRQLLLDCPMLTVEMTELTGQN